MDNRDFYLLKYLAQFDGAVQIREDKVSEDVRNHFDFTGLDVDKHPNSIWVRLFQLEKQNIVSELRSDTWEITPFGREKYAELHWQLMRHAVGAIVVDMPINATCEMIFNEHIKYGKVIWTKDLFKRKCPKNLDDAYEKMIHEGIIYKTGASIRTTMIASEYENAKSYEEAKQIRQAAKDKPQGNSITMNDGIAMIGSQSNNDLAAFSPTNNPPTAPTIAETKHGIIKTVIKFILNNIVLVIILGVIAGLIVAYYTHLFGWN